MSNLVDHAERELQLAGMFDNDADYGGSLAEHILEMVKVFSSAGHSGGSAAITIGVLHELLQYNNLTPLTDNPDEWVDHGSIWQSKRRSDAFSKDDGKTYYLLDDGVDKFYDTVKS